MPHDCVLLQPDGTASVVHTSQWRASELLGGDVTFVGAISDLNAFAVSKRTQSLETPLNRLCCNPDRFDTPVFGTVLFVGTGPRGGECSVDRDALIRSLERDVEESSTYASLFLPRRNPERSCRGRGQ